MSLFRWSTPERRSGDRILPIVPNEIYFHIFDCIAPPNERLTPGELRIFTNLSRVCRFFANVCLPRIFYFIELSGSVFCDDMPTSFRNNAVYRPSRGSALCTQIAAKQPLALALAKTVRVCRFTSWHWPDRTTGSWAVRLFADTCTAALPHMTHVRELTFYESFVESAHWRAIAALGSGGEGLETLSFDMCPFRDGPTDVAPHARTKIRVSHLRVTRCSGTHQPVAVVDPRYLRTLVVDGHALRQFDWLPQSALRELQVYFWTREYSVGEWLLWSLHAVVMQAPRSLETLWLFISILHRGPDYDPVGSMFDDPAWKNVPLLRSLTLSVRSVAAPGRIVPSTLEGITRLTQLRSFTVKDDQAVQSESESLEILRILRDKVGTTSNLEHVGLYGMVFRLADGEWSKVSS